MVREGGGGRGRGRQREVVLGRSEADLVRHALEDGKGRVHPRQVEQRRAARVRARGREEEQHEAGAAEAEGRDEVEVEQEVARVEGGPLDAVQVGALAAAAAARHVVQQQVAHRRHRPRSAVVRVAIKQRREQPEQEQALHGAGEDGAQPEHGKRVQAHRDEHGRDERPREQHREAAAQQAEPVPVGEPRRMAEQHAVHAGSAREQRDAGVEHAAARARENEHEQCRPCAKPAAHGAAEERLGLGAQQGKALPERPEGAGARDERCGKQTEGHRVQLDVDPRAQRELGRVLPGLHARATQQVVERLPVVEGLVAVHDRRGRRRQQPHREQRDEAGPAEPPGQRWFGHMRLWPGFRQGGGEITPNAWF